MTRSAWFHCFAGTAGDMTMSALVDAGADPMMIADVVGRLDLTDYALTFEAVTRCGIGATQAHVVVHDEHDHDGQTHRAYRSIRELIDAADLPERVRDRAQRTFRLLADVEGAMHRVPADDVEFHEVGSIDAIVDIVGSCGPRVARCRPHRVQLDHRRRRHGARRPRSAPEPGPCCHRVAGPPKCPEPRHRRPQGTGHAHRRCLDVRARR